MGYLLLAIAVLSVLCYPVRVEGLALTLHEGDHVGLAGEGRRQRQQWVDQRAEPTAERGAGAGSRASRADR